MTLRSSHRPHHRAALLIAVPMLALALTSGCATEQGATAPSSRTASPLASATHSPPSAVRVPPVNYSDPRSVASGFLVAWASYDAVHDGPDAFAARCRPLATARLGRELADDQPASADWAGKQRRHEVSVVRVAALRQPDGAPTPTSRRVYFRVYGDRITTNTSGRRVSPTGVTLVLVHRGRSWLVDRVLFV